MRELIGLRAGVRSAVSGDGELFLAAWPRTGSLGRVTEGKHVAVRRLADGPVSVDELATVIGDDQVLRSLLGRLVSGQWLYHTVLRDESPQYTVRPRGVRRPYRTGALPHNVMLSRFATLRRDTDGMVLSSPLSTSVVLLHNVELIAGIGKPAPVGSAAHRLSDDLWRAHFLVDSADTEDSELRLAQWSSHELTFHDTSRRAGSPGFGATGWANGRFEPVPARREPFDGETVALSVPDEIPVTLEDRRSVRDYDDENPITVEQLGHFLYRSAHVRSVTAAGTSTRPSPSGGGLHELEIYPVTRSVPGLGDGVHHYDPFDHKLETLPGSTRVLLDQAALAMGKDTAPQVLLVITARFGRTMWKYQTMAYALTLKNVGALQQTMYLVATAMGLAPCAIEAGTSDVFAETTGIDPLTESPVGEFALGSRARKS
nr:SagB family peptide dehydrogenase [Kibdelosporangium phytohabitans]